MTTNQTIDGVPRELLEQFLAGGRQCDRDRLRALLDAPAPEIDGEQWYADTPDGDGALVHRVAALCKHPSMSFHQVALLEGAISESKNDSKPAAQPQGEPVYQVEYVGGYAGWRDVDESTFSDLKKDPRYKARIMYAEQPAPAAVARMCDCNQGRLPCTCKTSAYDGFDNGVD